MPFQEQALRKVVALYNGCVGYHTPQPTFSKPVAPGLISNVLTAGFRPMQLGIGVGLGRCTHIANGRAVAMLLRAERANGFTNLDIVSTSTVHLYGLLTFNLTK